jgi:hypothetical protein
LKGKVEIEVEVEIALRKGKVCGEGVDVGVSEGKVVSKNNKFSAAWALIGSCDVFGRFEIAGQVARIARMSIKVDSARTAPLSDFNFNVIRGRLLISAMTNSIGVLNHRMNIELVYNVVNLLF